MPLSDNDIRVTWLRALAKGSASFMRVKLEVDDNGIELSLKRTWPLAVERYYVGDNKIALLVEGKTGEIVGVRIEGWG